MELAGFSIRKVILLKASLEWRNNIDNALKEGIENRVIHRDVEVGVAEMFVMWLYHEHSTISTDGLKQGG